MQEITLFKNKYRIKSTRLINYDYSTPGAYLITICTKNRIPYFGHIHNNVMGLSTAGCIAQKCWYDLPNHYSNCILDEFIIMPNHVHGIIILADGTQDPVETGFKPVSFEKQSNANDFDIIPETGFKPVSTKSTKQHSLSEIIRGFKTFSAKKINDFQKTTGQPLWQTRFYDQIISDEYAMNKIREYIEYNPMAWDQDRNNAH